MNVAQDRLVEGYTLSLSKDELAQDMLQPASQPLKGCATEEGSPGRRKKTKPPVPFFFP